MFQDRMLQVLFAALRTSREIVGELPASLHDVARGERMISVLRRRN